MRRIAAGTRVHHRIEVAEWMTVDFEQPEPGLGKLHPVYATYWLAKHFELVSRKLTLPYLEEEEEGIGFELSVRHLRPSPPGSSIDLEARLLEVKGNRIYCQCEATDSQGRTLGVGSTTQVVLLRSELEERFRVMRESSSQGD